MACNRADTRGDAPVGRRGHIAVIYDKKLFVYGGRDGIGGVLFNKYVHSYNIEQGVWVKTEVHDELPNQVDDTAPW